MQENETNVAPGGTSPEPAKTAENVPPIAAPGAPAGGAGELPQETGVSYPAHHHDVAQIDHLTARIFSIVEPLFAETRRELDQKIDDLEEQIAALKATEAARPIEPSMQPRIEPAAGPHELAVGDPVKVWMDGAHKTFRLGDVVAVHGAADAYDVRLDDEDGSVAKVPADGLEFDDRR